MIRNLAYTSLVLMVFALPLENVLLVEGVGTLSRLLGLIAFPLCLPYIVVRGRVRFHWMIFWYALFVCWAVLTLLWSENDDPLRAVLTPAQLLLFVWLIIQMIETPEQVEMTFKAYVLGCAAAAILTAHAYLGSDGTTYQRFAASGFNPNDMALILALGLPMALFLMLRGRWLWALAGAAYAPLGMYAIVLTASRSGLMAAMVALVYPLLLLNDRTVRGRVLLMVALAVAAGVLMTPLVPDSSWTRLATTWSELSQGSLNARTRIWEGGFGTIDQNTIFGVGLGGFSDALSRQVGFSQVAHNAFVATAAELGLIGLAIFVLALGSAIWGLLRLPVPERRMWYVLMLVLGAAFMSANFETRKQSWLVLALAASHSAAYAGKRNRAGGRPVAVPDHDDPLRRLEPLRSPR